MNDQFVVKVAPTILIKDFFNSIGLRVVSMSHPAIAKYSYVIKVRDWSLRKLFSTFAATIDLQSRTISVRRNNSTFLEHAKNIVSSIDPLMQELEITNGQWTIKVVE